MTESSTHHKMFVTNSPTDSGFYYSDQSQAGNAEMSQKGVGTGVNYECKDTAIQCT